MIYDALPFLKIVIFHSKPLQKPKRLLKIPRSVALFPLSEALLPLTYLAKIKKHLVSVQDGAPKIAKLPYKWLYGRYNYS